MYCKLLLAIFPVGRMEPTFETALTTAQHLLDRYQQDTSVRSALAQLLASPAGARGFFVIFLGGDYDLTDPALREILAQAPAPVAQLLVKNLVMSTAMILTHQRRGDAQGAEGSQWVQGRSAQLLAHLPQAMEHIQGMREALTLGTGPQAAFLIKWGYDAEQKEAMLNALQPLDQGVN